MTQRKGESGAGLVGVFIFLGVVLLALASARMLWGDIGGREIFFHVGLSLAAFGVAGRIWSGDRKSKGRVASKKEVK